MAENLNKENFCEIAAVMLVVLSNGPVSAQSTKLADYAGASAFLQDVLSKKGKTARNLRDSFRARPNDFKIWGSIHRACPTNYWWNNSNGSQKDTQRALQNSIKKELKGFPTGTIKKCMEVGPIFLDRKPTKHWRNKSNFYTNEAAIALKDVKTGSVSLLKSLASTNTNAGKTKAVLYNEKLQSVCSISNINMKNKTAKADCKGLGRGDAVALVKGRSVTFSISTPKAVIFAVLRSNISKAKRNYPDIFK